MEKTCSKKGPWHRWKYVKSRRDDVNLVPNEYIYRCGCGHLGIVPCFGFSLENNTPPGHLHLCEFEGCENLATHITGVTLYCEKHKDEPDYVSQRDWRSCAGQLRP